MQVFVLALELEHAALELDLLGVEGGELRGELLARLGVDRLATLELLVLAASLRRLGAPLGGRLADVRGEDGDEGGLLRELVELHHLDAPAKDRQVVVEVAQDVASVLGVQLERVVRRARGGDAEHLNLLARHHELVRRAEQAGGGDEARAILVHVECAEEIHAVVAAHHVRTRPGVRRVIARGRGRILGRTHTCEGRGGVRFDAGGGEPARAPCVS